MYLHRKSEESSSTSIDCYWKKPKLSGIGTSIKFMKTKDLFPLKAVETPNKEVTLKIFKDIIDLGERNNINCQLGQHNYNLNPILKLSIHKLILDFKTKQSSKN